MLIVRSPVRISFGGGGTDLPSYFEQFGGSVLSTSINKYFYTILQKRHDDKIQVISSDLRVVETWQDIARMSVKGSALEIPLSVLKQLGCKVSMDLFLASEIPPGTGLGSSASVCVNVIKTLSAYLHMPMSRYELAEKAFEIAHTVLDKPVGKQDEYASAFGGLNYIVFQRDGTVIVEPVKLDPALLDLFQANLMLFFTGAAHDSWAILKEQEQSTGHRESATVESLHQIRELADRMRSVLVAGDLDTFGQLLHDSWQAKKRVSQKISNSHIDQMYAAARANGAIGGKITGAGGGGFLLLFCPREKQASVREAVTVLGGRGMQFELDFQGAQVLVNDPFVDGDEKGGMRWIFQSISTGVQIA
jgi:D-glycero-alpha-D-manno-heptose-7-phosphate kinase